jgi:hypothetical protein
MRNVASISTNAAMSAREVVEEDRTAILALECSDEQWKMLDTAWFDMKTTVV